MARNLQAKRWFDNSQPQTLQIAVMLLYFNAVLGLIFDLRLGGLNYYGLIFILGQAAGAFGIANSRKWGYWTALVFAILPLAWLVYLWVKYSGVSVSVINLMFQIALVVLLLHPQHRDYRRIWFR